jgi:hypothetical protein
MGDALSAPLCRPYGPSLFHVSALSRGCRYRKEEVMDVKLNDDNMKDIIAKAVLDTLTPEARTELLSTAVKSLLTIPNSSGYGQRKSPLQEAFNSAIQEVAHQIAREQLVGNTEVKAKIEQMIADAWAKLTNDENYSQMVERVTSALGRGLTGDRY